VQVRSLLWDNHNILHIARHSVTSAEVEQVVFSPATKEPLSDDRHRLGRLVFVGHTDGSRALVVVTDRPTSTGEAYVVTARPATERERRRYLEDE
jgi:uncharacterized DUF497 family protein